MPNTLAVGFGVAVLLATLRKNKPMLLLKHHTAIVPVHSHHEMRVPLLPSWQIG